VKQTNQDMLTRQRSLLCLVAFSVINLISACSSQRPLLSRTSTNQNLASQSSWNGKINLTLDSEPKQFFAAEFDLEGDAQSGDMQFYSPLGTTLAAAKWETGVAQLIVPGKDPFQFDCLNALNQKLLGTELPVNMIFEWANGATPIPPKGWSVTRSSQEAQGKPAELEAQRDFPLPSAHLSLRILRSTETAPQTNH
jgi:outer membrane lipoprotein LolB